MMSGHTNAGVAQCTHTDAVVWALILMLWYVMSGCAVHLSESLH